MVFMNIYKIKFLFMHLYSSLIEMTSVYHSLPGENVLSNVYSQSFAWAAECQDYSKLNNSNNTHCSDEDSVVSYSSPVTIDENFKLKNNIVALIDKQDEVVGDIQSTHKDAEDSLKKIEIDESYKNLIERYCHISLIEYIGIQNRENQAENVTQDNTNLNNKVESIHFSIDSIEITEKNTIHSSDMAEGTIKLKSIQDAVQEKLDVNHDSMPEKEALKQLVEGCVQTDVEPLGKNETLGFTLNDGKGLSNKLYEARQKFKKTMVKTAKASVNNIPKYFIVHNKILNQNKHFNRNNKSETQIVRDAKVEDINVRQRATREATNNQNINQHKLPSHHKKAIVKTSKQRIHKVKRTDNITYNSITAPRMLLKTSTGPSRTANHIINIKLGDEKQLINPAILLKSKIKSELEITYRTNNAAKKLKASCTYKEAKASFHELNKRIKMIYTNVLKDNSAENRNINRFIKDKQSTDTNKCFLDQKPGKNTLQFNFKDSQHLKNKQNLSECDKTGKQIESSNKNSFYFVESVDDKSQKELIDRTGLINSTAINTLDKNAPSVDSKKILENMIQMNPFQNQECPSNKGVKRKDYSLSSFDPSLIQDKTKNFHNQTKSHINQSKLTHSRYILSNDIPINHQTIFNDNKIKLINIQSKTYETCSITNTSKSNDHIPKRNRTQPQCATLIENQKELNECNPVTYKSPLLPNQICNKNEITCCATKNTLCKFYFKRRLISTFFKKSVNGSICGPYTIFDSMFLRCRSLLYILYFIFFNNEVKWEAKNIDYFDSQNKFKLKEPTNIDEKVLKGTIRYKIYQMLLEGIVRYEKSYNEYIKNKNKRRNNDLEDYRRNTCELSSSLKTFFEDVDYAFDSITIIFCTMYMNLEIGLFYFELYHLCKINDLKNENNADIYQNFVFLLPELNNGIFSLVYNQNIICFQFDTSKESNCNTINIYTFESFLDLPSNQSYLLNFRIFFNFCETVLLQNTNKQIISIQRKLKMRFHIRNKQKWYSLNYSNIYDFTKMLLSRCS